MFNNKNFREIIVRPTLQSMGKLSDDSENLLIMTMAHESNGGSFLKQVDGPALGVYQMEKKTHDAIWNEYLPYCDKLVYDLLNVSGVQVRPVAEVMIYNLIYATAMARIFYLRINEPIPSKPQDMASYCKKYWNTSSGKATADEYLNAYKTFIGEQPNDAKKRDVKKDVH